MSAVKDLSSKLKSPVRNFPNHLSIALQILSSPNTFCKFSLAFRAKCLSWNSYKIQLRTFSLHILTQGEPHKNTDKNIFFFTVFITHFLTSQTHVNKRYLKKDKVFEKISLIYKNFTQNFLFNPIITMCYDVLEKFHCNQN